VLNLGQNKGLVLAVVVVLVVLMGLGVALSVF
jgi:hypothetical protein